MRRHAGLHTSGLPFEFQSTHPVWGATCSAGQFQQSFQISIHAPRVGCDVKSFHGIIRSIISIHAPRVGCDGIFDTQTRWSPISIHAPRVGCDADIRQRMGGRVRFQSTHPVWGATALDPVPTVVSKQISIHAPRVGCDLVLPFVLIFKRLFQSTHPVWGATRLGPVLRYSGRDFNPRTPCGVRPSRLGPVRCITGISIHAPRVGCDCNTGPKQMPGQNFNPRTPCGVRRRCSALS